MQSVSLPLNQALSIFTDNLADIRLACLENAQAVVAEYTPYEEWDIDATPVSVEVIRKHCNHLSVQQRVKPLLNTVKRIDSYRYYSDPKNKSSNAVTDLDIQNAREVSADWFIQEAGLCTRKPHQGLCPFHPDKKPSLTLMQSKARGTLYVKCFVCNEAWDSLSFIQRRDGIGFIDAVRYINGV